MTAYNYEYLTLIAAKQGKSRNAELQKVTEFNSPEAKEGMKDLTRRQYVSLQLKYFQTHYSGFTVAAGVMTVATAYLAALAVSPTLFPLGLAALSGYALYGAASVALIVVAATGYVAVPRFLNEFGYLIQRFKDAQLSNDDVKLLAVIAFTGVAFIGALHLMPAFLPFIGTYAAKMSTTAKVVADAVVSLPAGLALYAMFRGRPAPEKATDSPDPGLEKNGFTG